jgi:phospholipase C
VEQLEDRQLLSGDIHTIQHVVMIMQENRSFDSYFGTYPGADGIPMQNGVPTVSVYDPLTGQFVKPYHTDTDITVGGPHQYANAVADINGGALNGFLSEFRNAPDFSSKTPDVMAYWDNREIPNYWSYASNFVLQDHMFAPVLGWSKPSHLYWVSGWSATCSDPTNPFS